MEGDQLKLLEERINKAIVFIEKLKTREKTLNQEKEKLRQKIMSLEEEVVTKDKRIEELVDVQRFLKEKIETILNKLESFSDVGSAHLLEEEKEEMILDEEKYREEIIIDDNVVDLKEEKKIQPSLEDNMNEYLSKKDEQKEGGQSNIKEETQELSSEEEHKDTLFKFRDDRESDSLLQPQDKFRLKGNLDHNLNKSWFESNPFVET